MNDSDWTTAVMTVATVANAVLVFVLVWVTKRYVDETATIARATLGAAEAAERSAAAAERQVLLSVRPVLTIPSALNFTCYNEKSMKVSGGRDVLAPYRVTLQISNRGAGHAFAIQPQIEVEGISFAVGGFRPEGCILRDEEAPATGIAVPEDVESLFGRTHLTGVVRVAFRDATGAKWLQEWPFQTGEDVSMAVVQEPRIKLLSGS